MGFPKREAPYTAGIRGLPKWRKRCGNIDLLSIHVGELDDVSRACTIDTCSMSVCSHIASTEAVAVPPTHTDSSVFIRVYTDIRTLRGIIRKHGLGLRLRICCWWI